MAGAALNFTRCLMVLHMVIAFRRLLASLITQRSQVQILPAQPTRALVSVQGSQHRTALNAPGVPRLGRSRSSRACGTLRGRAAGSQEVHRAAKPALSEA